jgi:SAM-dependent methyltransferase
MDVYWNHNTAYHAWLIDIAARHHGHVVDVGCGEGLLVQRLAAVPHSVVGVDSDPESIQRAGAGCSRSATNSGLSVNKTIADWTWAALCTPVARVGWWLHRETRNIGAPGASPRDSLGEIRRVADDVLPGAVIRRGLYYRFRMLWRNG